MANAAEDGVLAVITRIEGPSYRPLGARMAIFADGGRVGTLSSGCIEADIVLHAEAAMNSGTPASVVYGRGSPFIDIKLPCGGGLEILLVPRPDREVLARLSLDMAKRVSRTLLIDPEFGELGIADKGETGFQETLFQVRILPEIYFYVFGKGPEASTFAALVQSAGFPNLLLSPDEETLEFGLRAGCRTMALRKVEIPADAKPDFWSAVVLFFHDHDWEPLILKAALKTSAFYIGAQGSRRARDLRLLELEAMNVAPSEIARLKGPVGLIPSARDARTLAVSVLAEILETARVTMR